MTSEPELSIKKDAWPYKAPLPQEKNWTSINNAQKVALALDIDSNYDVYFYGGDYDSKYYSFNLRKIEN